VICCPAHAEPSGSLGDEVIKDCVSASSCTGPHRLWMTCVLRSRELSLRLRSSSGPASTSSSAECVWAAHRPRRAGFSCWRSIPGRRVRRRQVAFDLEGMGWASGAGCPDAHSGLWQLTHARQGWRYATGGQASGGGMGSVTRSRRHSWDAGSCCDLRRGISGPPFAACDANEGADDVIMVGVLMGLRHSSIY